MQDITLGVLLIIGNASVGQTDGKNIIAAALNSYLEQRAMVENLYFETERWDPFTPPISVDALRDTKQFVRPKPIEGIEKLTRTKYQIDMRGRFRHEQRYFKLNQNNDDKEPREYSFPQYISFNGEIYHNFRLYEGENNGVVGGGSIFTPEHDFDTSAPEIKMTFFMDHIFNDAMGEFLTLPGLHIENQGDGTWKVKNPLAKREDSIREVTLGPAPACMITEVVGSWTLDTTYTKSIGWNQTSDGFYYPTAGSIKLISDGHARPAVRLTTTRFELNADESHGYTFEIPEGVRVTDYRNGTKKEYYVGQPGRLEAERTRP